MDLPSELLEEIINYVPGGKIYVRNCSLVAKSWVYPSRRRLFNTVFVWGYRDLKLWLGTISPTNVGVLQHIHSLHCKFPHPPCSPRPPVDLLRDYWPSFRQLEHLTLITGFLPSLPLIGTFSAFKNTLLRLSLRYCSVTTSGLVTLVNYFPNLAHLDLSNTSCWVDGQPTPPLSRLLQKLTITGYSTGDGRGLLDQVMGLGPHSEDVTICMYQHSNPSLAQRIIDGVGTSVKYLYLESYPTGVCNAPKIV